MIGIITKDFLVRNAGGKVVNLIGGYDPWLQDTIIEFADGKNLMLGQIERHPLECLNLCAPLVFQHWIRICLKGLE